MQFFSSFEHSTHLEMAITALEEKGISRENIFAVPLESRHKAQKYFDTMHYADGVSFINKGTGFATAFSVIGASRGFVLKWGPIYWGLIGAVTGFILGILIDLLMKKVLKKTKQKRNNNGTEVILIIDCDRNQEKMIEDILWHHLALGVAKVLKQPSGQTTSH
ncbi:hypothetical protein [Bacillus sp. PS06]|uniref:hypothetical protein n=1 Tax=Bacillus sp. PS06 TaxID=2764176 RepID=UPI00177F8D25|nr:hypothetical protein [Bacillus sp. PS06]MBD8070590.1 hypothetical protein [Bacillus sp. PS06]